MATGGWRVEQEAGGRVKVRKKEGKRKPGEGDRIRRGSRKRGEEQRVA